MINVLELNIKILSLFLYKLIVLMKSIVLKTPGVKNILIFEDVEKCLQVFNKMCRSNCLIFIDDDLQFEMLKDDVPLSPVESFTIKYKGSGLYNFYTLDKFGGLLVIDEYDITTSYELVDYTEIEKFVSIPKYIKFDFTNININQF